MINHLKKRFVLLGLSVILFIGAGYSQGIYKIEKTKEL